MVELEMIELYNIYKCTGTYERCGFIIRKYFQNLP